MKKRTLLLTASILFFLSGCASKNEDQQDLVEEQAKQIEALTNEKKQLELLLQNQKEKTPVVDYPSSDELDQEEQDDLSELFQDFIHAQFEQDKEQLSELTTAPFYTILTDNAGEAETDVLFQNTVTSIDVYKVEQVDESAYFVGKITVETKVDDFSPNSYEQLIECTAERNSEGVFQVDSQQLTTLSQ